MARPRNPDPTAAMPWRIPVEMIDWVRAEAERRGILPGAVVGDALRHAACPPPPGAPIRPVVRPATPSRVPLNRTTVEPRPKAGK